MEERIIDKDELRKIKVKKNAAGGVEDVTEETLEGTENVAEDEVTLELPDLEEYEDEDLVGLSPSQLKRELERREKAAADARAERDRLLEEGERLLKNGKFEEAKPFFAQAALYDPECARANQAIWICHTEDFGNLEPLYELDLAREFAEADDETKKFVRRKVRESLEADRALYLEEAAPLREQVEKGQRERRSAFLKNRNYYFVRFSVFMAAFALMLIAAGVSAYFIVRTNTMIPIILVGVFGALALVLFAVAVVFSRKLLVAQRLCGQNEKLTSTDDGERLDYLLKRLECLSIILDDEE